MKLNKLTEKQKEAYHEDSSRCPYCRSGQIEGASVEIDRDHAFQAVSCLECHRDWVNTYTLSTVEDGEQTCNSCYEIINEGDDVALEQGAFRHVTCPTKD